MTTAAAYDLAAFVEEWDPRYEGAAVTMPEGGGAVVLWSRTRDHARTGPLHLYESIEAYATDAAREVDDAAFRGRLCEWLEALGIDIAGI